jgi:HD-GYP domain-containing protein (c-di-GMP phosphodiesterase class II)
VLGKIEIPEKKKATTSQEPSESSSSDTTSTERKKNPRKEFTPRPQKNPVALQREREEREAERKRKEKLQREKEKKTYNYLSRVKTQAPAKKSQYVKEQIEEAPIVTEEKPKSLWGEFLRWLRT